MEKAGLAIPKILKKNKLLVPYKLYQAKLEWPAIAGAQIAKYSYILDFAEHAVRVAVLNSVWMSQLFMHKAQLIQKINGYIQEDYVRDIRFVRSGHKPAPIVYATQEGEEEDLLPDVRVSQVILPKETVASIYQRTASLPDTLREKVVQLQFMQAKRNRAYAAAGLKQCPRCGRWLAAGETRCLLCRLKERQAQKQALYRILIQMPWLSLEELEQHQYVGGNRKQYVELYNEIRRECIYTYMERVHHGYDTAEDDMLLALFITRKKPSEMTDAFIHNLTEKYRRKDDVPSYRRQPDGRHTPHCSHV